MDKKQLSNLVVRCLILKHIENCKMVIVVSIKMR